MLAVVHLISISSCYVTYIETAVNKPMCFTSLKLDGNRARCDHLTYIIFQSVQEENRLTGKMKIFAKLFTAPSTTIRQDLPPPGGYKPIQYARVPPKTYFSGKTLFLVFGVVHFTGCWLYMQHKRKLIRWEVENNSCKLALMPMLMAEKDRAYLKVCRKNYEIETELMKDVPGWEVGTYYGDKIFHTLGDDEWFDLTADEYFAHTMGSVARWSRNWYKQL